MSKKSPAERLAEATVRIEAEHQQFQAALDAFARDVENGNLPLPQPAPEGHQPNPTLSAIVARVEAERRQTSQDVTALIKDLDLPTPRPRRR